MIKVYRIEHPGDQLGFWTSKDENDLDRCNFHPEYQHINKLHTELPTFLEDDELAMSISETESARYKYAFNSIEDMFRYFTKSGVSGCLELGFRIYELTLTHPDKYIRSRYQTIFRHAIYKDITSRKIIKWVLEAQ